MLLIESCIHFRLRPNKNEGISGLHWHGKPDKRWIVSLSWCKVKRAIAVSYLHRRHLRHFFTCGCWKPHHKCDLQYILNAAGPRLKDDIFPHLSRGPIYVPRAFGELLFLIILDLRRYFFFVLFLKVPSQKLTSPVICFTPIIWFYAHKHSIRFSL